MIKYLEMVTQVASQFLGFEINVIPRAENSQADALSKLANSSLIDIERTVMVEVLNEKRIEPKVLITMVISHDEWYSDIVKYKLTRELLQEKKETTKVKKGAIWFVQKGIFSTTAQMCHNV